MAFLESVGSWVSIGFDVELSQVIDLLTIEEVPVVRLQYARNGGLGVSNGIHLCCI